MHAGFVASGEQVLDKCSHESHIVVLRLHASLACWWLSKIGARVHLVERVGGSIKFQASEHRTITRTSSYVTTARPGSESAILAWVPSSCGLRDVEGLEVLGLLECHVCGSVSCRCRGKLKGTQALMETSCFRHPVEASPFKARLFREAPRLP